MPSQLNEKIPSVQTTQASVRTAAPVIRLPSSRHSSKQQHGFQLELKPQDWYCISWPYGHLRHSLAHRPLRETEHAILACSPTKAASARTMGILRWRCQLLEDSTKQPSARLCDSPILFDLYNNNLPVTGCWKFIYIWMTSAWGLRPELLLNLNSFSQQTRHMWKNIATTDNWHQAYQRPCPVCSIYTMTIQLVN